MSFSVNVHDQCPMVPWFSSLSSDGTPFNQILNSAISSLASMGPQNIPNPIVSPHCSPFSSPFSSLRITILFFFTFWEAPFQDSEPDNSLVTLAFNLIALNYCFYPGGHILKSIRILLGRRRDLSSYGLEILFENVQNFPKMSTNGMAFENDTVFSFWGTTPLSNSSQAGTCSVNVFSTLI